MKMRKAVVEEQIQQVLLYIQKESVNVWKKNVLKDLGLGNLKYKIVEIFLVDLRKEFGEEDEEAVKVVELKRLEQGNKTMEEFF